MVENVFAPLGIGSHQLVSGVLYGEQFTEANVIEIALALGDKQDVDAGLGGFATAIGHFQFRPVAVLGDAHGFRAIDMVVET